jgi:hypothetical protein
VRHPVATFGGTLREGLPMTYEADAEGIYLRIDPGGRVGEA